MGIFRKSTPSTTPADRAAEAAAQAAMAGYASEDRDDNPTTSAGETKFRLNKAIRVAKGQRIRPRDEHDGDSD
ncbi:hypothetical protein [Kitasatospora sp. NPDC093806]|uniref:hypothetical protein n=1 Tax=Kitasatospora sp. NPDC093806 TaxID=3155075 RepID=UPI003420A76D